ncbi:MAG: GDSL-type esterase/lipase family protein [Candidatus Omnitrophica bacterium]|nr:GDSL-type esterase/lipase family protein [Candidatus Omnitrophota bacterium]MDD5080121.1 GDSL-type esterase/lipase family protein [Candidatus Omnitrophota bacterium]
MTKFTRSIVYVLSAILLVFILELISFSILPDGKLNRLESILRILEEDAGLFWKVKSRLDTPFEGVQVRTNSLGLRSGDIASKKEGVFRVIAMGASPTFGWGVEAGLTYPAVLERKLAGRFPGRKVEIINAGQIGYTSHQGLILLGKCISRYSPDMITVSYVLNDIDRYRFFRNEGSSDKDLAPGNPLVVCWNNIAAKSRFIRLLRRAVSSALMRDDKFAAAMFKRQFNLAKVRVEQADYRANLIKIADLCRERDIRLVFIKMPVHLSLPRLNEEEEGVFRSGKRLSGHYYDLGCDKESKGEYRQARVLFAKAKDFQVFEINNLSGVYNGIMADVARRNNLFLVDAVEIFAAQSPGEELFNGPGDPIHPSARGHGLIASALCESISADGSLK